MLLVTDTCSRLEMEGNSPIRVWLMVIHTGSSETAPVLVQDAFHYSMENSMKEEDMSWAPDRCKAVSSATRICSPAQLP